MLMKRWTAAVFLALLLALAVSPAAWANSAEPPRLTVVVNFAPEDLQLFVAYDSEGEAQSAQLERVRAAWEAQYRLYSHLIRPNADEMRLVAAFGGQTLEFDLPETVLTRYHNVYSLDLKSGALTSGLTLGRSVTLVSLRVGLTLILEALVFLAFGYRQKRSWTVFLAVNLITQGALNIALDGSLTTGYLLIALFFYEILVLIAELFGFLLALREHGKLRAVLYVVAANLLSLVLGGFLISLLPV